MNTPALTFGITAICLSVIALGGTTISAADVVADRAGFEKIVKPLLSSYCTKCHGVKKQESKLTLHDVDPNILGGVDVERWQNVLEKLVLGEMPPEDQKQPSAAEKQKVLSWIQAELKKAGKSTDLVAVHDDPAYGNRVDHEALFSGKHKGPAYSPSRLWRISPYIVNGKHSKRGHLSKYLRNASQPFSVSDDDNIKDYATMWKMDGPTLELLLLNADETIKNQIGPTQEELDVIDRVHVEKIKNNQKLTDRQKASKLRGKASQGILKSTQKEIHAIAYSKTKPTREQMESVIRAEFLYAMRREPKPQETERLLPLYTKAVQAGGNLEGTRAVLTAILLMPETIYRMELGLGKPTEDGRRMLAPMELAFALGYALRDAGPDKEILADANSGKLLDKAVVAKHVERIWDANFNGGKKSLEAERILRFFQEYFGYTGAPTVFKDGTRHPGYKPRPDSLVGDTDELIFQILKDDKDVFRQLLTTNKVMPVYARTRAFRRTTTAYGIDEKALVATGTGDKTHERGTYRGWRWYYAVPKNERAGILTQPSWLTAQSQNFDNDPVKRGKWVYERLLAGVIPDLPITVDANVPADRDKTLRARFEKTKAEYCWKCHKKMNTIGMAFEMYDDVGRFRTKELLRDNKTTVPVDTRGEIIASGVPGLDGPVKDAIELMHKLANQPRARQTFVRYAFRYWMGRNETLDDSPTLIAADKAFVESGGSMKALVTALITSDSFLYRK